MFILGLEITHLSHISYILEIIKISLKNPKPGHFYSLLNACYHVQFQKNHDAFFCLSVFSNSKTSKISQVFLILITEVNQWRYFPFWWYQYLLFKITVHCRRSERGGDARMCYMKIPALIKIMKLPSRFLCKQKIESGAS